ncbi:hypothetical protein GCM10022419_008130 [Nonomuraea rosea]|uniref:Phage tail tape measure protein n=1 Tax=Nonomuraea rosea TaxID=638574 RepID=A0ABP6V9T2_9ACTN
MALTVGELVAYAKLDRKDFTSGVKEVERSLKSMQGSTTSATGRIEQDVSRSMDRMTRDVVDSFRDVTREAGKSGQSSGGAFSSNLKRALDDVERIAGRAGHDAGKSFTDEARDMLRYGEFDFKVDAEIASALASIAEVERALDGLDDERVKVDVDTSSATDSVDKLAGLAAGLGGKFDSALSVIGSGGPANVAVLAAAIAALPTVAGVAASGIVLAIGGGLLAAGITAAAGADKVKHAWSEAADAIKADLADTAEPLEDSLVHAADVAEKSFDRLKPSLAKIFKDLVPDVDQFIDAVGDGVASLGPSLERVGSSFGKLLNGLSDRIPDIMDSLGDTFTTFSDIVDEHPTMLADLVTDAAELLEAGAKVLSWADELKVVFSAPLGPAGSQAGTDYFMKQMFGATQEELFTGMEEFSGLIGKTHIEAMKGIDAMRGVGGAGDQAAAGVRSLSDALENMFDPAAKALDAEIRLKEAIEDANQAAKDDKMSTLDRLRAVQDTTKAIADAAKTESERTGKTKDATAAYMDQLPHLNEWAGKNDAAKASVAALGDSLGVTTVATNKGKFAVDAFGNAVKLLPNGKTTKVDADTKEGKRLLEELKRKIDEIKNKTVTMTVKVQQDGTVNLPGNLKADINAAGDIHRYAAGGLRAFAAGGRMSPAPHIATGPTILFGEGSDDEAFIPYASQHRSRAVDLLKQVAEDFGLEVYNKAAAKRMSDVGATIDATGMQVSHGLDAAKAAVTDALGGSGSLTTVIQQLGAAGDSLVDGWKVGSDIISKSATDGSTVVAASVTDMTESMTSSIQGLTSSVSSLAGVIGQAQSITAGGKGKSDTGSLYELSKFSVPRKPPGGMVEGHNAGGFVSDSSASLSQGSKGGVTVNIENATVRQDADIAAIGQEFAFEYMARA